MNSEEIKKLLDSYIANDKQQGCFLIKGEWGVGKTYFISEYIQNAISEDKDNKVRYVRVSLFGKTSTAEIVNEINSKLISGGEKFKNELLACFKGVSALSIGVNLDLTAWISSENQMEKKTHCVFFFDDLERVRMPIDKVVGFINNINENYKFKVVVLSNIDRFNEEQDRLFQENKEKAFFTEVIFGDCFGEIAASIIRESETLKSQEPLILESFSRAGHGNLRTLIFAIQKIEQIVEAINESLDEDVLSSLMLTIVWYSIKRTKPASDESDKKGIDQAHAELQERIPPIYDMAFLEPFVNNDDYSLDDIIEKVKEKQQYAVANKDNPLPFLQHEWLVAEDDVFSENIEKLKLWIEKNNVAISEYPNILATMESDFFIDKLRLFVEADEYIDQIAAFMKTNINNADDKTLASLPYGSFYGLRGGDKKGRIKQLQEEIHAAMEKYLKQSIDCDILFGYRYKAYERLEKIADKGIDVLEVCSSADIVERIKQENDLHLINNARLVLSHFYDYDFPCNTSPEEHRESLKANENVKKMIESLKEYIEQENVSKSKKYLVETLISSLEGTRD
jgi:DNA polymerase III delta prime subunit